MRGLVLDFGGVLDGPGADGAALGAMIAVLRQRGVRTAVLSNDPGGDRAQGLRDLADRYLVDDVVLSGDAGVAKPDAASYRLAAQRLGLAPSECVFVDDLAVNVRGAAAAGMVGVHHDDPQAVLSELAVLFGIDTCCDGSEGDTRR
ncbi:HAD-IA family hydrolase [Rhodococcus chondri]|uniref:HAD-IA family hydrolase n=1 Tax=Rhodococcus chondri TaxID=3065941 RepID=A0ABU7JTN1_9NOCA|nr:HAD-IA family hydrolase [Rhodococcus sp. CC-R104]MEE2032849.1 HAD-IA family hydrolase [Rhodococcus sp. CC-R104]